MYLSIAETEPGQNSIVYTDGKSYYYDQVSGNDKTLLYDPEAFFLYIEQSTPEHLLSELPHPTSFYIPSPVRRAFLPAINFRTHSDETKMKEPDEPYFFTKFPSSLVHHGGTSYIPRGVEQFDYEGEIAIVIGKKGKYLSESDASSVIYGYSIVNDLSIRDYQMKTFEGMGKDWVMGKAADTALPYGPWILPASETDGFRFRIRTEVNGEVRQDAWTDDMIFSPEQLISRLSMITELRPGDIITTGTPSGVAMHSGKGFLKKGDTVRVTVDGIGTLETHIDAE